MSHLDATIARTAAQLVNEHGGFPAQEQRPPGATAPMRPNPDHGEESYVGHGRLEGMRALITGGDSGIGRATAIAFAREGADVALSYLDSEQDDAEATAHWVTQADRKAALLPGGPHRSRDLRGAAPASRSGPRRHRRPGQQRRLPDGPYARHRGVA